MIPSVFNSQSKLGVWVVIIAALLHMFLPEFGIEPQEALWNKIFYAIELVGTGVGINGFRNALAKIQYENGLKLQEQPKD